MLNTFYFSLTVCEIYLYVESYLGNYYYYYYYYYRTLKLRHRRQSSLCFVSIGSPLINSVFTCTVPRFTPTYLTEALSTHKQSCIKLFNIYCILLKPSQLCALIPKKHFVYSSFLNLQRSFSPGNCAAKHRPKKNNFSNQSVYGQGRSRRQQIWGIGRGVLGQKVFKMLILRSRSCVLVHFDVLFQCKCCSS